MADFEVRQMKRFQHGMVSGRTLIPSENVDYVEEASYDAQANGIFSRIHLRSGEVLEVAESMSVIAERRGGKAASSETVLITE